MEILVKKREILMLFLILLFSKTSAQKNKCNYFNLPKPNTIPKDFNPEILHLNGSFKFNVEFTKCDEIYFTTLVGQENIYFSKKIKGVWSKPKIASFSDPSYSDADPFLNKKGTRIYFISKRPTHKKDKSLDWNIWSSAKKNDKWQLPKPLPKPINSDDSDEYFFSISNKENVFFSSNRKGGEGSFDIYTAKILANDKFSKPKNLGQPVNTSKYEFDPYISPDENFILFSINQRGNSNLYFSKRDKNDNWTTPRNLGDTINITNQDFAPSISSDGKFIFYSNNGELKWVSTAIIKI